MSQANGAGAGPRSDTCRITWVPSWDELKLFLFSPRGREKCTRSPKDDFGPTMLRFRACAVPAGLPRCNAHGLRQCVRSPLAAGKTTHWTLFVCQRLCMHAGDQTDRVRQERQNEKRNWSHPRPGHSFKRRLLVCAVLFRPSRVAPWPTDGHRYPRTPTSAM